MTTEASTIQRHKIDTLEYHEQVVAWAASVWPYTVAHRSNLKKDSEAREWCEKRHGVRGNSTNAEMTTVIFDTEALWVESGEEVRFKDEHHAFEFKMRWV